MKAAYVTAYGGPEKIVVGEWDKPTATAPDHVVIEVFAASLNPIDYKRNRGDMRIMKSETFPHRFGYDVSGIVAETGTGVTNFNVGDAVYARVDEEEAGTLAEYVLTTESKCAKKPSNMNHKEAAALPLAAMTALQAFERAGVKNNNFKKAFITGGAGGVGHYAIQITKNVFGIEEVATTVSEKKMDLIKSLGADVVIDYKKEKYVEKLSNYDFVFDTTGEVVSTFPIIRKGGHAISIATIPDGDETARLMPINWFVKSLLNVMSWNTRRLAKVANVNYQYIFLRASGAELERIRQWVEEGKIKSVIDSIYSLDQSAEAMQKIMDGHATGKIVVEVKA
ncbi:hypothetical protein BZG36_01323 [Bifiguratus adelaidae]|uniref:Enoyl reductase (ER) domain-containing protein n=1 Tax=Bifiguratus adelaidae TaxID=1938954 RepID=A0A261Y5L9_9FUNG|nr:hypothetical protein BZG36_01323 [Bifiguratus adelaidae]